MSDTNDSKSPWEVPDDDFASYSAHLTVARKMAGDMNLPTPVRAYLDAVEREQARDAAEIRLCPPRK